jgi:hypothetical protein
MSTLGLFDLVNSWQQQPARRRALLPNAPLDTMEFTSHYGIDGLAKLEGDGIIFIGLFARDPGTGQLRAFIKQAKNCFPVIWVTAFFNDDLPTVLLRYGFKPCKIQSETLDGKPCEQAAMVWKNV